MLPCRVLPQGCGMRSSNQQKLIVAKLHFGYDFGPSYTGPNRNFLRVALITVGAMFYLYLYRQFSGIGRVKVFWGIMWK